MMPDDGSAPWAASSSRVFFAVIHPAVVAVLPLGLAHADLDRVLLDDDLALARDDVLVQVVLEEPVVLAVEVEDLQVERVLAEVTAHPLLELTDAVDARHDVHVHVLRVLAVPVLVPPKRRDRAVGHSRLSCSVW